jgi:hypothetical protein
MQALKKRALTTGKAYHDVVKLMALANSAQERSILLPRYLEVKARMEQAEAAHETALTKWQR